MIHFMRTRIKFMFILSKYVWTRFKYDVKQNKIFAKLILNIFLKLVLLESCLTFILRLFSYPNWLNSEDVNAILLFNAQISRFVYLEFIKSNNVYQLLIKVKYLSENAIKDLKSIFGTRQARKRFHEATINHNTNLNTFID